MAHNTKCCGCYNLDTGSKVIGGMVMFTSILSVFYCIGNLISQHDVLEPIFSEDSMNDFYSNYFNIINGVSLCIEIILATTGFLVMLGVQNKKLAFFIPYLIVAIIVIGFTLLFNGLALVQNVLSEHRFMAIIYLANFLYGVIQLYWWTCIMTLYKEIKFQRIQITSQM